MPGVGHPVDGDPDHQHQGGILALRGGVHVSNN